LLEKYLKVVDYLTVNKQVMVEQVSETQQQLVAKIESKDKEMDGMKQRMEDMEYQLLPGLHDTEYRTS
jgi:hypothetical protein